MKEESGDQQGLTEKQNATVGVPGTMGESCGLGVRHKGDRSWRGRWLLGVERRWGQNMGCSGRGEC